MRKSRSKIPKVHFLLKETHAFAFELPVPPSVNRLFANAAKGRVKTQAYRTWRDEAGRSLIANGGIKAVRGPVIVTVTLPDAGKYDLDNAAKAILDFTVHHGIIEDDKREIVREVRLSWGDVPAAVIEVSKAYDWIQRRQDESHATL